jgi:hypothetical protein
MVLRYLLGVTALAFVVLGSSHFAKADDDDQRGPSFAFSFGGPAYYPPPQSYEYAPPPVYAPPEPYGYPAQGQWHEHHHDDDDDGDDD